MLRFSLLAKGKRNWGWKDSTMGKALPLHTAYRVQFPAFYSVLGALQSVFAELETEISTENCQVWVQSNKRKGESCHEDPHGLLIPETTIVLGTCLLLSVRSPQALGLPPSTKVSILAPFTPRITPAPPS